MRAIDNLSIYRKTPVMTNFEKAPGRDDKLLYRLARPKEVIPGEIKCE